MLPRRERAEKAQEGWQDTRSCRAGDSVTHPREKWPPWTERGKKMIGPGAGVPRQLAAESQEAEEAGELYSN